MSFLQTAYFGNTVQDWAIALGVALGAFLGLRIITSVVIGRVAGLATSTRTDWDDIISAALARTKRWILLIFALAAGAIPLVLPRGWEDALRAAVESLGEDEVRFDRGHFQSYGDFALIFEIVYYVLGPDYNLYMDCQQAINLFIHRRFEEEGIEFAYPTQTLFLVKEGEGTS